MEAFRQDFMDWRGYPTDSHLELTGSRHVFLAYAWLMAGHRHIINAGLLAGDFRPIPVEFELLGEEAIMHRDGDRLVIEPVRKRGLITLLKTMKPLEEDFPKIEDSVPAPENML